MIYIQAIVVVILSMIILPVVIPLAFIGFVIFGGISVIWKAFNDQPEKVILKAPRKVYNY